MRIAYATLLPQTEDRARFLRHPLASGYLCCYAHRARGDRDEHDIAQPDELFPLQDTTEIAVRVLRSAPHLVALTVYVWNHVEVASLCRQLRTVDPFVKIVI